MDGNGNGNGNGDRKGRVSTLALTFQHDTFHLDVKGELVNYECALAMLDQAKRFFEQQIKLQAAQELQKKLVDNARVEELMRTVAKH